MILRISLLIVAIGYVGFYLFALFFSSPFIFPAPEATYVDTHEIKKLTLDNEWEISIKHLPNPDAGKVLLYSHGNGEDLGIVEKKLDNFHKNGWAVFAYDYPGYGTSHGTPSEKVCFESIEKAYKHLVEDLQYKPEDIVLYGYSLGGGPSFHLAQKEKVGGVIVEGTYTSIFKVATYINILPWDVFDNQSKINEIDAPLLVIHGTEDTVVPFWHGKALFDKANTNKHYLWIEGAEHGDLVHLAGDRYWDTLTHFRNNVVSTQQ